MSTTTATSTTGELGLYPIQEIQTADLQASPENNRLYRQTSSALDTKSFAIQGRMRRAKISPAKIPFLQAIEKIIDEQRDFWPLSDRRIHYALLNDPPLRHASKPDSVYRNDKESYKSLTELLTRARVAGNIPMEVIFDPTRPVTTWDVNTDVGSYLDEEMDDFGLSYWRDLMQSQPNHIEIVGEKNTLASTLRPVAMQYRISMTIGRGFCSLRPRYDLVQRFWKSDKDRLVLLFLSDFDPEGEEIAQSFARSIRDDFGVKDIEPIKVALTAEQVADLDLPPMFKAKKTSSQYDKFTQKHGDDVWELEALEPARLQEILTNAIDDVIDVEAFNYEIDREKEDSAKLEGVRQIVIDTLQDYRGYEDNEEP